MKIFFFLLIFVHNSFCQDELDANAIEYVNTADDLELLSRGVKPGTTYIFTNDLPTSPIRLSGFHGQSDKLITLNGSKTMIFSIFLDDCSYFTITEFNIVESLYIQKSHYINVTNLYESNYNIKVFDSSAITLERLKLVNSLTNSIMVSNSNYITISKCLIKTSDYVGIWIEQGENILISNNIIYNHSINNFYLDGSNFDIFNNYCGSGSSEVFNILNLNKESRIKNNILSCKSCTYIKLDKPPTTELELEVAYNIFNCPGVFAGHQEDCLFTNILILFDGEFYRKEIKNPENLNEDILKDIGAIGYVDTSLIPYDDYNSITRTIGVAGPFSVPEQPIPQQMPTPTNPTPTNPTPTNPTPTNPTPTNPSPPIPSPIPSPPIICANETCLLPPEIKNTYTIIGQVTLNSTLHISDGASLNVDGNLKVNGVITVRKNISSNNTPQNSSIINVSGCVDVINGSIDIIIEKLESTLVVLIQAENCTDPSEKTNIITKTEDCKVIEKRYVGNTLLVALKTSENCNNLVSTPNLPILVAVPISIVILLVIIALVIVFACPQVKQKIFPFFGKQNTKKPHKRNEGYNYSDM